ncbi:MAG: hypothetical protein ACM3YE_00825 [Bacteroidota bacterium]
MKIIDLKDRFGRSLVAGFFYSVILWSLNMISYYVLHFSKRRFINYSALMIFGREFNNLTEAILCSIAQIFLATGLIVIFSYFILKENSKNYLWRGFSVGFGSWFSIMSIMYMIRVHKILEINIKSAFSFMVTSIIYIR